MPLSASSTAGLPLYLWLIWALQTPSPSAWARPIRPCRSAAALSPGLSQRDTSLSLFEARVPPQRPVHVAARSPGSRLQDPRRIPPRQSAGIGFHQCCLRAARPHAVLDRPDDCGHRRLQGTGRRLKQSHRRPAPGLAQKAQCNAQQIDRYLALLEESDRQETSTPGHSCVQGFGTTAGQQRGNCRLDKGPGRQWQDHVHHHRVRCPGHAKPQQCAGLHPADRCGGRELPDSGPRGLCRCQRSEADPANGPSRKRCTASTLHL